MKTFIEFQDHHIAVDAQGYLKDHQQWSESLASLLAEREGIELSEEHWAVIRFVRQYYLEFNSSPAIRPLVKYLQQHWGPEKGNSIFLHKLFKEPAKQATKIAGLPKPARCV